MILVIFQRVEELSMVNPHVEDGLLPVDELRVGAEDTLGWKTGHFWPFGRFTARLQICLHEDPLVAKEIMTL